MCGGGVPSSHPSLGLSVFFLSFCALALTQVHDEIFETQPEISLRAGVKKETKVSTGKDTRVKGSRDIATTMVLLKISL